MGKCLIVRFNLKTYMEKIDSIRLKPCKKCGSPGVVDYQVAETPYWYNGCSNQNCDAFNNDNEFKSHTAAEGEWNRRNR